MNREHIHLLDRALGMSETNSHPLLPYHNLLDTLVTKTVLDLFRKMSCNLQCALPEDPHVVRC